MIENKKYGNNYDYNRAIYLMEKQAFLKTACDHKRKTTTCTPRLPWYIMKITKP
ncbi:MAG: hypothetical protein U5L96_18045 [Owenweeksia sp.]|nr:hypothetical protein [Owenweeksia sp.]